MQRNTNADLYNEEVRRECQPKIPPIPVRTGWLVRITPPGFGAVARFRVSHVENPTADISVYLDWYDRLGCMGEPYWEAYRGSGTEPERFLLTEAEKLAETIDGWLKEK